MKAILFQDASQAYLYDFIIQFVWNLSQNSVKYDILRTISYIIGAIVIKTFDRSSM